MSGTCFVHQSAKLESARRSSSSSSVAQGGSSDWSSNDTQRSSNCVSRWQVASEKLLHGGLTDASSMAVIHLVNRWLVDFEEIADPFDQAIHGERLLHKVIGTGGSQFADLVLLDHS